MLESSAACLFAIRDKTSFCALLAGLLKINSALTLVCFAGRDDADDFFLETKPDAIQQARPNPPSPSRLVLSGDFYHLEQDSTQKERFCRIINGF